MVHVVAGLLVQGEFGIEDNPARGGRPAAAVLALIHASAQHACAISQAEPVAAHDIHDARCAVEQCGAREARADFLSVGAQVLHDGAADLAWDAAQRLKPCQVALHAPAHKVVPHTSHVHLDADAFVARDVGQSHGTRGVAGAHDGTLKEVVASQQV